MVTQAEFWLSIATIAFMLIMPLAIAGFFVWKARNKSDAPSS